jgi:hypothetical protein
LYSEIADFFVGMVEEIVLYFLCGLVCFFEGDVFLVFSFPFLQCRAAVFLDFDYGVVFFVFAMGWITGWAAVALSSQKRRPSLMAILTFPIFSLILASSVLFVLIFPTKQWKPIPHGGQIENEGQ